LGESFDFVCSAHAEIESCSICFEAVGKSYSVRENATKDEYVYLGKGFKSGDCGIRYLNVTKDTIGKVTCKVSFPDEDTEIFASMQLQLLKAVRVHLDANKAGFEFIEGDQIVLNCSAENAPKNAEVILRVGMINFDFFMHFILI
jgi:hypothetical protein